MKSNLTQSERVVRILLGSLLLSMSLTHILGSWAFYTGLAALLSSALSYCLIYGVLGIRRSDVKYSLNTSDN